MASTPPAPKKRKAGDDEEDAEPIRDDDTWTTGDYALVSSDNVRFRVDLVHLLSAISVFRDMASVAAQGADRELHFTDDSIETAAVLERFLTLLIDATVDDKDIDRFSNFKHLASMTRFLVKYDCPFLMTVLGLRVKEMSSTGRSTLFMFIIGSIMDDTDLCISALSKKRRTWGETSVPDTNTTRNLTNFHCLNPQSLAYNRWSMIPGPYLYALHRAWALVGDSDDLKTKFQQVLDDVKGMSDPQWRRSSAHPPAARNT
ncbi:uncharacterized protein LOC62_03G003904 [Vanrija pseudolonga]|uniref:BTB domain-containing protein n=1 Tax=Vanrija pseudolonga TaxID=143232 RepID=A0AAF0Y6S1_9TREE|nr:hypothetical protein LOC62_03G003904 [Vanrija pseudolonga]